MIYLPFIIWFLFLQAEIVIHWFVIEMIAFDLTPDKKVLTFSKALVILSRVAAWLIIWWAFAVHSNTQFWWFTSGCFFSHLLIFPIQLNWFRGERLRYLGKGFVDKVLGIAPFEFRVWCLMVLTAGSVSAYYYWL